MYCQDKGSTASKSKEGKSPDSRPSHARPFPSSSSRSSRRSGAAFSYRPLSAAFVCVRTRGERKIKIDVESTCVDMHVCATEREKEDMNEREVKGVPFQDRIDGRRTESRNGRAGATERRRVTEKRRERKEKRRKKMKIILSLCLRARTHVYLCVRRARARRRRRSFICAVYGIASRWQKRQEEGRRPNMQFRREKPNVRLNSARPSRLIFALTPLINFNRGIRVSPAEDKEDGFNVARRVEARSEAERA